LLAEVQAGLERIERGISRVQRHQQTDTLTVSTTNSFAEMCLLPHLPEFSDLYPDAHVRIIATDKRVDFIRDHVDIAIRFGRGGYQGFNEEKLLVADYVPVCAPALLSDNQRPSGPQDLARYMLIDTDWPAHQDVAPNWQKWFAKFDATIPASTRTMRVSVEAHAVKSALSGLGIALVQQLFVEDALADGSLVQIMGKQGTITPAFRYDMVWPEQEESTLGRHFRNWLSSRLKPDGPASLPAPVR